MRINEQARLWRNQQKQFHPLDKPERGLLSANHRNNDKSLSLFTGLWPNIQSNIGYLYSWIIIVISCGMFSLAMNHILTHFGLKISGWSVFGIGSATFSIVLLVVGPKNCKTLFRLKMQRKRVVKSSTYDYKKYYETRHAFENEYSDDDELICRDMNTTARANYIRHLNKKGNENE